MNYGIDGCYSNFITWTPKPFFTKSFHVISYVFLSKLWSKKHVWLLSTNEL